MEGQRITGTAASNHYSGDAVVTATTFQSKGLFVTAMGCSPRKRMVAEKRYIAALEVATTLNRDGNRLRLSGGGADLEFELVPPPKPAPFEDTQWHLDTLVYDGDLSGSVSTPIVPATIRFRTDGRVTRTTDAFD